MITPPAVKFIGDEIMVLPIMSGSYLLSHKDLVNYYYPAPIVVVDKHGTCFQFQKADLLPGIQWGRSFQKLCILYRIQPVLTEAPYHLPLADFQKKVIHFIQQTPKSKGLDRLERSELISKVMNCPSHLAVCKALNAVSYWK